MESQASAGWYPDQSGAQRYWDGQRWTDTERQPEPTAPATKSPATNDGILARRKKAKDERESNHAETVFAAGSLVTSGVFGTSTIELYEGGYVRVASGEKPSVLGNNQPGRTFGPGQPVRIKKSTPFERLRSITFTPAEGSTSDNESSLGSTFGPTVSKLVKGGRSAFKGSVPGLAAAGIAHVASTGRRTSHLTIETDREIHQLTNQGHNGYAKTVLTDHVSVGQALQAAGRKSLGQEGPPAGSSSPSSPTLPAATANSQPSASARLRELTDLHKDGVLTDEEYAAAKARVLDSF